MEINSFSLLIQGVVGFLVKIDGVSDVWRVVPGGAEGQHRINSTIRPAAFVLAFDQSFLRSVLIHLAPDLRENICR